MNRIDATTLLPKLEAPATDRAAGVESASGGFGEMVKGVLESANRDQLEAEKQALALAEGRGDIVDAMVSLSKADLSLRFVVTLRNRAVEAYREIMNLQL
ncbi:MAG: flagellar hook-basal body complex protein FliE [Myxococcota bacterium]|nr:flagellar hook-basal body complex protein FliE [Myxococcota bacterium]